MPQLPADNLASLEVYGIWVIILHAATYIACSYNTASEALNQAFFGQGTGPILLDNLRCTNTETSLFFCPHNGVGSHNCNHGEDAGVRCTCKCCNRLYAYITQFPTPNKPATMTPTTNMPTTLAPTTNAQTTMAPSTNVPATMTPTTNAPTTMARTTNAPTTMAPASGMLN